MAFWDGKVDLVEKVSATGTKSYEDSFATGEKAEKEVRR